MSINRSNRTAKSSACRTAAMVAVLIVLFCCPVNIFSVNPLKPVKPQRRTTSPVATERPDSILYDSIAAPDPGAVGADVRLAADSLTATAADSLGTVMPAAGDSVYIFNPNPTRAVWLSALFPGLGQLYNRRYWKLPIIIGGFMGLGYATSWNNGMLRDYSRAYADILDNDPSTRSYMDFFPPTTREEDLNKTWLTKTLKSRKDYYRRNRDLCIICMVGVYLLAMVDAYVDASMAHFDISPALSMDVAPAIIPESRERIPGIGLQWALTF